MELNTNMNCDDDNFSNISRISCGLQNSINSTCNSDSEYSGPVSVRSMIQRYNNQFKKNDSNQRQHKTIYKLNTCKKYHPPSQHLLVATNSSYCGLNNYGSSINYKQFADHFEDDNNNLAAITCCKSCTACVCCQNGSRKNSTTTTKIMSSTSSPFVVVQHNENNNKLNTNFSIHHNPNGCCIKSSCTNCNCNKINAKDTRIPAVENCINISDMAGVNAGADINADTATATIQPTVLNDFGVELNRDSGNNGLLKNHNSQVVEQKNNHLLSTDSVGETNICQQPPTETSYQSKTTISKTSSGVRIIIDIFFDQERSANATDILGSRVETDIPQSRILTEFQQQTMAANGADCVASSYQGLQ